MPTLEIRLVALDWAGTTLDWGCLAPFGAFVNAFRDEGVAVTPAEARAPMGVHKKDHIRAMLAEPPLASRWLAAKGTPWSEADVSRLYEAVTPAQLAAVAEYADLIPGTAEAVAEVRRRGIKVGGTTGYFLAAAERCYEAGRVQGYEPDAAVCADEVPAGRPAPWMIFALMQRLGVYPPAAVLKVGDTPADVAEGLAAGAWSCGVTDSGNEVGLSRADWQALPEPEKARLRGFARHRLLAAGAHAVIDTVAGLPALVDDVNRRLAAGERP